MKKLIALLLAAIMVLSVFAGCSKQEAQPPAQTDTPVAKEEKPVAEDPKAEETEKKETVVIEALMVETDWIDAWDVMEARFEEAYPWIDVEAVGIGEGTNYDWISARFAADDMPDIIPMDNNDLWRGFCDEGVVANLKGRPVTENIPQAYLDAFTYNDTLMGISMGSAFSLMYYNMDILNQAGWDTVPANWEELLQCCQDIVDKTDAAPLTVAGAKTTTMWMIFELILGNVVGDELGQGAYEEAFLNGTFNFSAYPEVVERLDAISPYFMTGSATMVEDDVTAAMTDGAVAMCVAGNWTAATLLPGIAEAAGDEAKAVVSLPPFNSAGDACWISVSPESGFGLSVNPDRPAEEQEAAEIFFDWLWQPENFMLIQNARGTVPILSTMTDEHIDLPEAIAGVVPSMNAAPFVKMGFNLWTVEFCDVACKALQDCISGNGTAQTAVDVMWTTVQTSYVNK